MLYNHVNIAYTATYAQTHNLNSVIEPRLNFDLAAVTCLLSHLEVYESKMYFLNFVLRIAIQRCKKANASVRQTKELPIQTIRLVWLGAAEIMGKCLPFEA